mgnify:FL=1|jgi:hypothetical protein
MRLKNMKCNQCDTGLNNQNKTIKITTYRALGDKRTGDNDELYG